MSRLKNLLCVLISSKFCSISSYISTYTGGKWRPLICIVPLLVSYLPDDAELFSSLLSRSSSEDAFVDEGSRAPLSLVIDTSGDFIEAKPVFFTWNLLSDKDKTSRWVSHHNSLKLYVDDKSFLCQLKVDVISDSKQR